MAAVVDDDVPTNSTTLSLKNERLNVIRLMYQNAKLTPVQRRKKDLKEQEKLLEKVDPAFRNEMKASMDSVNRLMLSAEGDEAADDGEKIVEMKLYSTSLNRKITISSVSSRHWKTATVDDGGTVFLTELQEFGEYDDDEEEPDEESPDVSYPCANIHTQSGRCERPIAFDGKNFESVLVVPDEIMNDVKNEAPPGSYYSGQNVQNKSNWSPAPNEKVWCTFTKTQEKPKGGYIEGYKSYFWLNYLYHNNGNMVRDPEELWEEYGSLEYWCPVLHRFISDGERLRQEHWFHNGDGSANQRYFYNQIEMLDLHGGLTNLPLSVEDNELVVAEGLNSDQVLDKKKSAAEKKRKIICLDEQ